MCIGLIMTVIYIAMALLVIRVMPSLIIFGMGTCAFINSILLKNILIQCEKETAVPEAETGETAEDADGEDADGEDAADVEEQGIRDTL